MGVHRWRGASSSSSLHDADARPQYWEALLIPDNDIVRTIFMILFLLAEPLRLAAGFYGNLHENVGDRQPWPRCMHHRSAWGAGVRA